MWNIRQGGDFSLNKYSYLKFSLMPLKHNNELNSNDKSTILNHKCLPDYRFHNLSAIKRN